MISFLLLFLLPNVSFEVGGGFQETSLKNLSQFLVEEEIFDEELSIPILHVGCKISFLSFSLSYENEWGKRSDGVYSLDGALPTFFSKDSLVERVDISNQKLVLGIPFPSIPFISLVPEIGWARLKQKRGLEKVFETYMAPQWKSSPQIDPFRLTKVTEGPSFGLSLETSFWTVEARLSYECFFGRAVTSHLNDHFPNVTRQINVDPIKENWHHLRGTLSYDFSDELGMFIFLEERFLFSTSDAPFKTTTSAILGMKFFL